MWLPNCGYLTKAVSMRLIDCYGLILAASLWLPHLIKLTENSMRLFPCGFLTVAASLKKTYCGYLIEDASLWLPHRGWLTVTSSLRMPYCCYLTEAK